MRGKIAVKKVQNKMILTTEICFFDVFAKIICQKRICLILQIFQFVNIQPGELDCFRVWCKMLTVEFIEKEMLDFRFLQLLYGKLILTRS